jgi:hypothetical protein
MTEARFVKMLTEMAVRVRKGIKKKMPDIDDFTGMATSQTILDLAFENKGMKLSQLTLDSIEEWQINAVSIELDELMMNVIGTLPEMIERATKAT